MATTAQQAPPPWLQSLSQHRKEMAYVLFGISGAAAVGLALLAWKNYREYWPFWLWCGGVAVVTLGAGLYQYLREPGRLAEVDVTRLVVLALGGLIGLITTGLLGIGLTIHWWSTVTGGWEVWQGEEGYRIWWTLLGLVSGLAVMFVSLQLARTEERTNPLLRRLLYGYNAVLSGLLLLAILLIVNLLTYVKWEKFNRPLKYLAFLNQEHDWSRGSLYSLSEKSEKILQGLDRPVRIYVVMSTQDPLYHPVRALLDNCRAVTDQIQVEYVSPNLNLKRAEELAREFKFKERGLLVVVGEGSKAENHFIKYRDLTEASAARSQRESHFNGEIALIPVINHLATEGQGRPVLYFTQGNGELDIHSQDQDPEGASLLRQRLESRGFYQVRGLQIVREDQVKPDLMGARVTASRVPDDAAAVIVLGPRRRLPEHTIKALEDYMGREDTKEGKKKGKLMVFLGLVLDRNTDDFLMTGLERLVEKYNVQIKNDLILHAADDGFALPAINVQPPPSARGSERNPVAEAFTDKGFVLLEARTVQPQPAARPGASPYNVDILLEAPTDIQPWAETDLNLVNPEFIKRLIKGGQIAQKISPSPIPVAVAVSEDSSGVPPDAFHASVRRRGQEPRLVVMGNALCFINQPLGNSPGRPYDLFNSCLAWLRDRPADIGIDPKRSDIYEWEPKSDTRRMVILPGVLAAVLIVGLGAGVWIIRRR